MLKFLPCVPGDVDCRKIGEACVRPSKYSSTIILVNAARVSPPGVSVVGMMRSLGVQQPVGRQKDGVSWTHARIHRQLWPS